MSERQVKSDEPRYAACDCLNCGVGLEFDASDFAKGETRTVECPNCHKETSVFVQREKPVASLNSPMPEPERSTPKLFSDFIGQNRVKARLELAIAAAKRRGETLGHVLLVGSPGSGKATLANIINRELGANGKATSGSSIEKAGDLAGLLTNLEEADGLFIDEIHRLRRDIEGYLCLAIGDFKLDIIIDQGANARSVRLNLPHFTLIGSTTSKEEMSRNLLSRFQIVEILDDYSLEPISIG